LSTSLAGLVVVHAGFSAAFLALAGIAASGFLLYFFGMPETRGLDAAAPSAIAKRALSR
ncbi:MAG: MFS transporter, partial [Methylocella sp.]